MAGLTAGGEFSKLKERSFRDAGQISGRVIDNDAGLTVARRAQAHMDAKANDTIKLREVCAVVGGTSRSLQQAFKAEFGVSPIKYHQLIRLTKADMDLERSKPGETTVTRVAVNWGFWHLGHFSATYRRQFGEKPSDTLKRT